jgi:HlyD family secretion protein
MRVVRYIIPWVVLLVLAWLGYRFIWPLFLPEEVETDIQTTVVRTGDLSRVVLADGKLEPDTLVEVKSKASGVVESIEVEAGDIVAAGDIICELDKEQIRARLRQVEASLLSSEAMLAKTQRAMTDQQISAAESQIRRAEINLEDAQLNYDRIVELHEKGYATDAELDNARTQLDNAREALEQAREQYALDQEGAEVEDIESAEAQVEIRRAEVDDVLEELANTTIRAPIAGTVLTRPVEIGTAVASGTSGNTGGTVVATIGDMSTLYIKAQIDETDLGRVWVGMPCRISFDAFPGASWDGELQKIYPQGAEGQAGTRFPVDVRITGRTAGSAGGGSRGGGRGGGGGRGPGGAGGPPPAAEGQAEPAAEEAAAEKPAKPEIALRPNMTANVELILEDHPNVLIITAQFLQYDEEGQPYVEVLPNPEDQSTREERPLELGFTDGMRYEVLSGLAEGDTVIMEREIVTED